MSHKKYVQNAQKTVVDILHKKIPENPENTIDIHSKACYYIDTERQDAPKKEKNERRKKRKNGASNKAREAVPMYSETAQTAVADKG